MIEKLKEAYRIFLNKLISIFSKEAHLIIDDTFWWGLLWIWDKPSDYRLWATTVDRMRQELVKKYKQWDLQDRPLVYEYNQGAQYETRNWCTIYSAITELSFIFNREFTLEEIQRVWHKMIEDWKLDPNRWAYLSDAIDYVRRDWNENNPKEQIASYLIEYTDVNLLKVLDKYVIRPTQLGYRTSNELWKELRNSPYINKSKDYPKVWGHAVTRFKDEIVDNYNRITNINRYKFQYLSDLVENWVVFNKWYLFLKK